MSTHPTQVHFYPTDLDLNQNSGSLDSRVSMDNIFWGKDMVPRGNPLGIWKVGISSAVNSPVALWLLRWNSLVSCSMNFFVSRRFLSVGLSQYSTTCCSNPGNYGSTLGSFLCCCIPGAVYGPHGQQR